MWWVWQPLDAASSTYARCVDTVSMHISLFPGAFQNFFASSPLYMFRYNNKCALTSMDLVIILCTLRHFIYNSPPTAWILMRSFLFCYCNQVLSFYCPTWILGSIFMLWNAIYIFCVSYSSCFFRTSHDASMNAETVGILSIFICWDRFLALILGTISSRLAWGREPSWAFGTANYGFGYPPLGSAGFRLQ